MNNATTAQPAPRGTGRAPLNRKGFPKDWLSPEDRAIAVRRSVPIALAILGGDLLVYLGLVAVILLPIPIPVSLALGVVGGLLIGNVFTIGHDAGHQSLTNHRWLNRWLGRIAYVPAMHSFGLWVLSHNRAHHTYTNLRGSDYVWEPMSPRDFAEASPARRMLYRLYRSPFGSFPYYVYEFWLKRNFLPISAESRPRWRKYLFDSLFVIIGTAALMGLIVWAGHRLSPTRPLWLTWTLGWLVPFLCWNWIMGWIIFMHHTHPSVGWFADRSEWTYYRGQILGTVQARLPPGMDLLSNNIMEHTAHHSFPVIPMYRLRRAQALLRQAYPLVKALRLTPLTYVRTARACKLFDYERRQWVDFRGNPTGPVIPLDGAS